MSVRRRALLALAMASPAAGFGAPRVRVRVAVPQGSFVIEVDPDVAPVTVANFLRYVDGRHLDGGSVYRIVTLANQTPETAHRIEVIQWGMKLGEGRQPPFPPIAHETTRDTGLRHRDGTVSMARSTPGSAAGEFFICIGDQPELDFGGRRNPDGQGFAAFGLVTEGMDVVRAIHRLGGAQQFMPETIPVASARRV